MLSYRHGFHAGSFVDVHKHVALVMLLSHLRRKETPFCCLDTHAGGGLYDLRSRFAQKNREFEAGIARLHGSAQPPPAVAAYLEIVAAVNAPGETRFYPGSPLIARRLLRPQDRMILVELHSSEVPILKSAFRGDPQVSVHHRDAFEALPALVPPRERRGLVFIDPAYEVDGEFDRVVESLKSAWRRWPTGIYAVWYPVQRRQPLGRFRRLLRTSGVHAILMNELFVARDTAPNRLTGSGLMVVNPPWEFDRELQAVVDWLDPLLSRERHARPRIEWLAPQKSG
ncbi:MAG TPA: 23S rRNA (adenine(2030)-N(6))-methyltransferase RlmJ [Gammaproteobacteria bacterium]